MATEVVVTDTNLYKVKAKAPAQLEVTIGDAQVGGTSLLWDGKPLPFNNQKGLATIGGPGKDIKGTILHCMTIVQDENPATNKTSVTFTLTGGLKKETYPYSVEVKKNKERAHYLVTFVFVA